MPSIYTYIKKGAPQAHSLHLYAGGKAGLNSLSAFLGCWKLLHTSAAFATWCRRWKQKAATLARPLSHASRPQPPATPTCAAHSINATLVGCVCVCVCVFVLTTLAYNLNGPGLGSWIASPESRILASLRSFCFLLLFFPQHNYFDSTFTTFLWITQEVLGARRFCGCHSTRIPPTIHEQFILF